MRSRDSATRIQPPSGSRLVVPMANGRVRTRWEVPGVRLTVRFFTAHSGVASSPTLQRPSRFMSIRTLR